MLLLFAPFKEACKEVGKLEPFDKAKVFHHVFGNLFSFRVVWDVFELLSKGGFLRVRVVLGTLVLSE